MSLLDSIISGMENGYSFPQIGGPVIISENHDTGTINFVAGLSDPGEMISCGYLPEIRRKPGEKDAEYAERIRPIVMALPKDQRDKIMGAALNRANLHIGDNGKVALVIAGKPGWTGLGINVAEALNRENAQNLGGLAGWNLTKQQLEYNGHKLDAYILVRGDNGKPIGKPVGSKYAIISNEEQFNFADEIVDGVNTRYEVVGALGNGETCFMVAKMPSMDIAGETLDKFIVFTANHGNGKQVEIFPTALRPECQNTYNIARNTDGHRVYKIRHTRNYKEKMELVRKHLESVSEDYRRFQDQAETLAKKPMLHPEEYFTDVLDTVLDVTIAGQRLTAQAVDGGEVLRAIMEVKEANERATLEKSYERALKRRENLLEDIITRYESKTCNGPIKGSAWAAVNAITEHAQHSDKIRYQGNDRERAENRFSSILDGKALEYQEVAVSRAMAV